MAEKKYERYIREAKRSTAANLDVAGLSRFLAPVPFIVFDKSVVEEVPFWIEFSIVHGPGPGPGSGGNESANGEPFKVKASDGSLKPHRESPNKHPMEEIYLFLPADPDNTDDLGAEIECWLGEGEEAEKYTITKPSIVYIPKGLVHCPIVYRKVSRPFIQMIILNAPELIIDSVDKFPPGYKL